ncbi:unnamed protein product [Tilletia controversa]|nr:unnamed protein product [Tilletia controversa]
MAAASTAPAPHSAGFDFTNHDRNALLTGKGFPVPKATSTGTTINCEKIHYIAPHIYCCGAGTAADTEFMTQLTSSNVQLHELHTGRKSRVVTAMTMFKQRLFQHSGHIGAALVLGGYDVTGPQLFTIAPHGSTDKLPYVTMGSGSLAAMAVFESGWKKDMTRDEAIALVTAAIESGIYNDLGSGSNVDVCIIEKQGTEMLRNYRVLAREAKEQRYGFRRGTTAYTKEEIFSMIQKQDVFGLYVFHPRSLFPFLPFTHLWRCIRKRPSRSYTLRQLTGAKDGKPKRNGAWSPEEVDFLTESIQKGFFYVLCPDNETLREVDLVRIFDIDDYQHASYSGAQKITTMAATGRDPATLLCAQLEAIFCPALDPALVAAIGYEPNQSFDQATQILSQLVPELEPWEQSQPTTAAPATSSPSASTSSSPALNQSASPKDTDQIPASDPISETQLHYLLDQWEAQGTIIIPADDDPVLNLTDEESDPLHRQQLSSPSPPQQDSPKSPHESTSRSPASPPPTATTDEQQQPSNDGNLTTTLDELITAQLIADDPGLLQAPTAVVEERTKKEAAGLDLDKLAHGTRALRLDGAKKKRRKGDDAMGGGGMARTRSAGPLVRLGDVRQGGGANDGNTSAPSEAMRRKLKDAIDAGWKDPKDRLAVAIPAHLLQHTSSSASSSNASTTSLPSSPFLSSTFDVASDGDVEEERRRAIDDALLTQVDMRKIASRGHRDRSSAHDQNTPLAETSTWLLTSSVLSQLIHLLRPIPFSSPTSAAVERRKKRKRNPPLFSETEANAVHARSSFHLPRTLSRLIGRSAEVYDSYNRSLLKASTEGGVDGDGEWAKEKAIAAAFDLDELALTIAALAGIEAGSTDNRAKMALKATGGRSEEGGDPDAALDLLELWNGSRSGITFS